MPRPVIPNPWQIGNSDSEDEDINQFDIFTSLPPRPGTANSLTRSEPKIPDWHALEADRKSKGKFGARKTAPSFEKGPSSHKPIFCGSNNLKTSLSSSHASLRRTLTNQKSLPDTTISSLDPIKAIEEDLTKFIFTNIPDDYSSFIHCILRRDKTGIQKGFFPTYYLHFQRPGSEKRIFLLAARKVGKITGVREYLITTNVETLSEKYGGDGYVGKLQENNAKGTAYTLYDNGKNPKKVKKGAATNKDGLRRELIAIIHDTNLFGFKGSKRINAVIPEIGYDMNPTKDEDTILDLWHDRRFSYLIQLRNRAPMLTEGKKKPILPFIGQTEIQPSVKNFQMIMETKYHEEEIIMQFGRIGDDAFMLDYRYPLSAIQAFAIALSSFDTGISLEGA